MKKIILTLLGLGFYTQLVTGQVIINEKFDTAVVRSPNFKMLYKCTINNGALCLNGIGKNKNSATFKVSNLNTEGRTKIEFKVRRINAPSKGQLFALDLIGAENRSLKIYCRGKYFAYIYKLGKKTVAHKALSERFELVPGKDAKWSKIEIFLSDKDVEINLDGDCKGRFQCKITPIKELSFYSYNLDIELDDFRVEKLKEIKKNNVTVQEPVFYAPFDGSLNAKTNKSKIVPEGSSGIVFKPGVIGQAAYIGSTLPQSSLIFSANWKTAKGTIYTNNLKSNESLKLNVPELSLLKMFIKIKRLKLYPKEQHFGIIIKNKTNKRLMIYFRSNKSYFSYTEGGKAIAGKAFNKTMQLPEAGNDSKWIELQFLCDDKKIEVFYMGKSIGQINYPIEPDSIQFYAYNQNVAVDELKINGIIKSNKKEFSFSEKFDKPSLNKTPVLEYKVDNLFANNGTLMYWFRPDWDGKIFDANKLITYYLFNGVDVTGHSKLKMFMWYWLRADLGRPGKMSAVQLIRHCRRGFFKGDWVHLAIVWENGGWNKLFVNGLPYYQGFMFSDKRGPMRLHNLDMKSIKRFLLGSIKNPDGRRKNANGSFDELKIYKRPLSSKDVYEEFRKSMPVDIVMNRVVIFSNQNEKLVLQIAPGGYYMCPKPCDMPDINANIKLKMELSNPANGKIIKTQDFNLNINKPSKIEMPVGQLPQGEYRVICTVNYKKSQTQKSFPVVAYAPKNKPQISKQAADWNKSIFTKKCWNLENPKILNEGKVTVKNTALGKYLEAGEKNGNRFGFEISFPEKYLNGHPVVIEIEWPDDKPRAMALYMYPESKTRQHRERLSGGIQSGNEYPLTNKMQKTRYIFYPWVKNYLFEARTMISNYPAAVAAVKIYPLKGRLPKLAINYPQGVKHRTLGHMDEDQSFDRLLNNDNKQEKTSPFRSAKVMEQLCDYFDYTGQDMISMSLLKYNCVFYPVEGLFTNELFPANPGEIPLIIEMLNRRGKKFIATINFYTLPEIHYDVENLEKYTDEGILIFDSDGIPSQVNMLSVKLNPFHSKVQTLFLKHVKELVERYGNIPGFDGIDWWQHNFWTLKGLKKGYGDYTINLFSSETGIDVPGGKTVERYQKRYKFLTGPKRNEWLKWRASKATDFIKKVRKVIDKVNPNINFYISLAGEPSYGSIKKDSAENLDIEKYYYEQFGLNLSSIKLMPRVNIVQKRFPTDFRWNLHWGRPESTVNELIYNSKKSVPLMNGGIGYSSSFDRYFETFRNSLKPDVFKSYFQSADVKPFGRYFLKEFAFSLAAMDSVRMLIGAQPLGTSGRDDVTREFAQAYCALPAQAFKTVKGMTDPVTVRYLDFPDRTYFYAVSMLWSDCTVSIPIPDGKKIKDLSSGEIYHSSNGIFKIVLKPYQLRSFILLNTKLAIASGKVIVPQTTKAFYQHKLEKIVAALGILKKHGVDVVKYKKLIEKIREVMRQKKYAELHRLMFAKSINTLLRNAENGKYISEKMKMVKQGKYAVNCGSNSFYRAKNGTLFFPDQKMSQGKYYGHSGSHRTAIRGDTETVKNSQEQTLFETEAYDIDSYLFKVKPGKYKVKLYLKVGFKPNAKPGVFVFDADIEGKPVLKNYDILKKCGNDFNNVVIKEISKIEVKDGVLDIRFKTASGKDSSARLCNAIEVERTGD
jgi:malectin (di-glucose binding ER protein)/glycosyl hydrolase family 10